jgi:colanic acid/amylovoran biosynthesis glycosyltransferase
MTLERITYVVNVFPKLSETFIAQELVSLERRGIDVQILSLRRPTEVIQHKFIQRARLVERTEYDADEFREALRLFRPQVLHAHFATEATAAARRLADDFDLPFTFTAHGYDIYRRPPDDFATRAAVAAAVITVSQANARYISQAFGVPYDHIQVIPCGVDTRRFSPNGNRAEPPHIVCVARLVPVKNLALLLEACSTLRTRRSHFRCIIIGDGPCRAELTAMRQRLDLDNLVEFYGPADQGDVIACWQRAAIGVLTSDREGMPVSLTEAAACGVPVVATAVGGVPELVEHEGTGLLVQPGDACSLANALERLLGDQELRKRMGRAARRRTVRWFDGEQQVDRLCGIWTDVATRYSSAPVHGAGYLDKRPL